jgi:hypothetical protein
MSAKSGALLITPNGDIVEIDLPAEGRDRMVVLYAVLRCTEYDVVRVSSSLDMWIDGEYLYNHPDEPNIPATLFLTHFGDVTQMICGPVLITGGADAEGDTLPLSRHQLLAVLTKLADGAEDLRRRFGV